MGSALLSGLLAADVVAPSQVAIVEPASERRQVLVEEFPGVLVADGVPPCTSAVLAVKPPLVAEVAGQVVAAGATKVLSIAAGVTLSTMRAACGAGVDIVRAMPNTPAMVGAGVSAICTDASSNPSVLDWADTLLNAVGIVIRLDEEHFDAITGLTGSGPAYVFAFAEALIAAGSGVGLPAAELERVVTQLLVGSSKLLEQRGNPEALRVAVTSPGGTTAAGLSVFDEHGFANTIISAVSAARDRGRELGSS